MNWLTEHYPHIAAALAAGAATGALDHLIAKAENIIPNSAWQLIKALVLRTPIRALQGEKDMFNFAFLDELEAGIQRMKTLIAEAEEVIEAFKTVSAKVSALGLPAVPAQPALAGEPAPTPAGDGIGVGEDSPAKAPDPSLTP